jgi:imidazolonepropionase-like amidohydrolase
MYRKTLLLSALGLVLHLSTAQAQKTYLHCGRLLDMRQERAQTEATVIVENGRVVAVQKGYQTGGPADKVIDLRNRMVLPGLIDCHVHLEGETSKNNQVETFTQNPADIAFNSLDHARKTLLAGFTTCATWAARA